MWAGNYWRPDQRNRFGNAGVSSFLTKWWNVHRDYRGERVFIGSTFHSYRRILMVNDVLGRCSPATARRTESSIFNGADAIYVDFWSAGNAYLLFFSE
jgi:hypothetical protein